MNTTIMRADQLEARFERLLIDYGNLKQQVAGLLNQIQALQGGNQQPQNGGGGIYEITAANAPALGIGAGSSATGVTVSQRIGGTVNTISTNATVYNDMGQATLPSKTIIVGLLANGSFLVITQSC